MPICSANEFARISRMYVVSILSKWDDKRTVFSENGIGICALGVIMIVFLGYQSDMFRFQFRYRQTAKNAQLQKKEGSEASKRLSFDLAPAQISELPEPNVWQFIEKWQSTAIAEMDAFDFPASVTMAQAIIESRSGCSILSQSIDFKALDKNNVLRQGCNNFFGIKCQKKQCSAGHCTNHTDDTSKDFFVRFKNPEDSWRGHSEFLKNNGYIALGRQLSINRGDYKGWSLILKRKGYATDPEYAKKLIDIIEKYRLFDLDTL